MKHRWISIRHIDPNGQVNDIVQCENCGFFMGVTNQNIDAPIPRGEDVKVKCEDWLVKRVMEA